MASAVCKEQRRDRELGWRQGFNYPSHPAPAAKSVMVTLCIDGGGITQRPPSAPPLTEEGNRNKNEKFF